MMSYEELSKSVKLSEGFRNKIYQDTEGFDTIGWGHKVVPADNFVADKEYSEEELQTVFDKDLSRAIAQAKQLMDSKWYRRFTRNSSTRLIGDVLSTWTVRGV